MTSQYQLKPFVLNLNDLAYLLAQVNFVPLFDGPANSNGIVNFAPLTMDAWDAKGNKVWDAATQSGSYQGTGLTAANVALLGQGFPQVSSSIGIRDVTGLHNNLFGTQADWGAVDVPFSRTIAADFTNYVTTPGADYTIHAAGSNVIDYMPRIISRTITTGGVNLLQDGNGHFVTFDKALYDSAPASLPPVPTPAEQAAFDYKAFIDGSGATYAQLVDGAKIIVPEAAGLTLLWDATANSASIAYVTLLGYIAGTDTLTGGSAGEPLADGGPIFKFDGTTYTELTGLTFNASLYVYHSLVSASGVNTATLAAGDAIPVTATDVTEAIALLTGGVVSAATVEALLVPDPAAGSGYGLLETLGHIDFQNPASGEFFIGSENPGVAPVNSWFAIFGQFFDHGLDLIGKGGNGTITIALDPSDPLYGAPGPQGPVTSITVTRATIAGTDANGDPNYVNHTSPFIDQSQTYGSDDQITQVLRKWVSTDGNQTYHAGLELFDGATLVDAWTRKWPDGSALAALYPNGQPVHDTLPTLNELRQHVLDTGRAALNWADVLDFRNRDAHGQLVDSDGNPGNGVQTSGSGHALILDMNPHFDAAHVPAAHLTALNNALTAAGFPPIATLSYGALIGSGLINPATNLINTSLPAFMGGGAISQAIQAAVNDVMLNSVGDHYIAGDGRVNENFGLTSIHHVFHEEHNYQVENLKSWIYQHDTANSPADHAGLHEWQVNTGTQDAQGNYIYANGAGAADDVIAWDADKMFNATKLLVEMEYQHAAVDQYARTITPRIQEFVGYSSGVDSTISLEYSQVAFRFGHSTIRETIDTVDPSGWMLGHVTRYALEKAFLNPQGFADEGVAAITLGLARQQMNEVDEFITPALSQGLLGQPLDLAAINIARGRDLGIPTLNDFREGISLARYTSWADFGANMVHPESLVNFIAAYSFGGNVALAEAAMLNSDFMNNTGTLPAGSDGFNHIDSWIGGLAEAHVPGGLLGETFDAVFVAQIQSLMDGDRFYYLYRLFGTNIHEEVNNGQFKDIVERNTGLEHLNGSIFAYADKYYDFNRDAAGLETASAAATGDHANHFYADLLNASGNTKGLFSDGGDSTAANGTDITVVAADGIRANANLSLIRDVRVDAQPNLVHPLEGTPTDGADSHEVIVATENADYIHARGGDDTVYGEGGDDYIYGDGGIDRLYGGDGNDLLDSGEGPDLVDGGAGKDIIYGRGSGSEVGGFDQLVGGSGNDLIIGGEGIDKLSGGSGDDIIYGDGLTNPEMGNTDAFTHGGDGNDYIDTGASGDLIFAEEGDDYLVGGQDQDLMQGGQGDDILRPGAPSQASGTVGGPDEVVGDNGQANELGFDLIDLSDWAGNAPGTTIDFNTQQNPLVAIDQNSPFPAWFQIEGAIGTQNGDTFVGSGALDAAGVANPFGGSNWLIGGSGSDTFTANGGNDLIVGGSIRLDTLIGHYAGADFGNLALGSTAWLADAMQTGGTGAGYANNTEDAYTGASNRATGTLTGGLLAGVNATIAGTANDYALHFTEMLRSRMFKDVVLGDGGTDGTADKAVFGGNLAQYTLQAFDVNGNAVADPHANWGSVFAIRTTDNRTADDLLDADGNPLLDANGDPLTLDGSDLIVGVEKFQFADQTINPAAYFDKAPVLDLNFVATTVNVASDNFSGQPNNNAYGRGSGWGNNNNWTETGDGNTGSGSGQILVDTAGAGGTNNGLHITGGTGNGFDGASISRAVNLTSYTAATLSFSVQQLGISGNETVKVYLKAGGAPTNADTPLYTIQTGSDATATVHNIPLTGPFANGTRVYFVSTAMNATSDDVYIDNIAVTAAGDANPGINNTATYTEQLASAVLTSNPRISDPDDTKIYSATVHIRETVTGDQLTLSGALQADIVATGGGTGNLVLSSVAGATFAQFQAALQAVRFSNSGDNPTPGSNSPQTRHLDVVVNDGLRDSAVATTNVTVTPVNDGATLNNDTIVTNLGNTSFTVADWALAANDIDPDNTVSISGVNNASSLTATHSNNNGGSITIIDNATAGTNTFRYYGSGVGQNDATRATVTLTKQTSTTLNGTTGSDIIIGSDATTIMNGGDGNDVIFGNGGNDTLNGGAGDDTISTSVTTSGGGNNPPVTSGRDLVDGGANATPAGDRFILTGSSGSETFRIFSNMDDWDNNAANGIQSSAAHAGIVGLAGNTEIVITRNGTVNGAGILSGATILAELDNVEEITVNTTNVSVPVIPGTAGTDTVSVIGSFTATSLNFNTITVNGGQGNDTVDITGLTSGHRVVLNSGGGSDAIAGPARSQDVININDTMVGTSGNDRMNGGAGSDRVWGLAGDDWFGATDGDGNDAYDGGAGRDTYSASGATAAVNINLTTNTARGASIGNDSILAFENAIGGSGNDAVTGNAGNNSLFGLGGADTLNGGAGHDGLAGGAGNDTLIGGAGIDTAVFTGALSTATFAFSGGNVQVTTAADGTDTLNGIEYVRFAGVSVASCGW